MFTVWRYIDATSHTRLGTVEQLVDAVREADRLDRLGLASFVTDHTGSTVYRNTSLRMS